MKIDPVSIDAFASPNCPPLAVMGMSAAGPACIGKLVEEGLLHG